MPRLRWQIYQPPGPPHKLRVAIILVIVSAALMLVARLACIDAQGSTVFWPANGALVVALLVLPWSFSIPVFTVCLLLNFILDMFSDYSAFDDILYAFLNIIVTYTAALLTRNFCGARIDLSRFRRLITFSVIAFVSAGLEATVGELIDWGGAPGAHP